MSKSNSIFPVIAIFAACWALPASAAIIVTVGTYTVPAGTPVTAHINVTNSSSAISSDIEGMTFTLQIANGTDAKPQITSIDLLTGTVWAPDASAGDISPASGAQPQYQSLGILTDNGGEYIDANGLLATVNIDTTGATPGTYSLLMTATQTPGDDSTFLDGLGDTLPATFTAGSLIINPAPEPSTVILLSTFLLLPRRGKAQRLSGFF